MENKIRFFTMVLACIQALAIVSFAVISYSVIVVFFKDLQGISYWEFFGLQVGIFFVILLVGLVCSILPIGLIALPVANILIQKEVYDYRYYALLAFVIALLCVLLFSLFDANLFLIALFCFPVSLGASYIYWLWDIRPLLREKQEKSAKITQ